VDELLTNDIAPYATLYHWDLPQALQDIGGWEKRETAIAFADYAGYVTARLSDRAKHMSTMNEMASFVELGYGRWDRKILAETGWMGEVLSASVRPLLAVGAAGGFVSLLQATGTAELVAERIAAFHIGIAVPFLIALVLKALQGSPLVATLTAAGMIEPLLPGLGLGDAWGHALAAAAIGAGTLIVHINDPSFWLVADMAELTPAQTLALHTLGTLMQAATAIALLLILAG
jgi:H+/gluconate symporter-like permease